MAFAGNSEKSMDKLQNTSRVTALTMNQNYNMALNYRTLASTLELDGYQVEAVKLIHDKFIGEMMDAENAKASDRKALVKQAADKELKYMGFVLNDSQFDKFQMLLNVTLSNRGLLN